MESITEQSHPITAVLLCGGASRRMGRDKALLPLGGGTLLEQAIKTLQALASEVLLAPGAASRYASSGLREVLDSEPGQGPCAGILAGLAAASHDRVLFVAVDLPLLDRCSLAELIAKARAEDADVATLDDGRERPPLVLCIHRRVLPVMSQAFAGGARRIIDMTRGHKLVRLPVDPEHTVNWNRPEDMSSRDSVIRGEAG